MSRLLPTWRLPCAAALALSLGLGLAASHALAAGAAGAASQPAAPVPASGPAAPRLPVEAFAKKPFLSQVRLSDDGRRLVAIVHRDNDEFIAVKELGAGRTPLKPVWHSTEPRLTIRWVRWIGDYLLASIAFPAERFGVETLETRLVSFKADGSGERRLLRTDSNEVPPQFQDDVIDDLHDGRHVLVEVWGMPEDSGTAVYKLDITNDQHERVQASMGHVHRWVADQSHRIRAGVRVEDTKVSLVVRGAADDAPWQRLFEAEVFSRDVVHPLGFGKDPNHLFVTADADGRSAVFEMDLSTPDRKRTLRLADDRFDVGGSLVVSPRTHEVVGVQGGDSGTAYFDEAYQALGRGIAKALPERVNTLLQVTADEGRYLVLSEGNGVVPEYYLGDAGTGALDLLVRTYPQLPASALAHTHTLTLSARDGLHLPTLLTLPAGSSGRNLPAVVLPHGGPISADDDLFDPWVQFLANRGIAVLQVNFRGSSGFGHDLMAAGLKRWGLEMQDDITDATQWMIATGVADPKRVCIVGGSYGGYAALMGAVKTPDLYRCVVSFAGVSDLYELVVHQEDFTGSKIVGQQVASREGDMLQMRRTSPRFLADKVRAPVLLVHGTMDRSVPLDQSEFMAAALKSEGKDVRFVVQKGGDHHLSHYAQSLEFLTELDRFLAANLDLPAPAAK